MKLLSEMSLEELWTLFPIVLTKPDPVWPVRFEEMRRELQSRLPQDIRIRHMGSTALGTICAKPIVDILIEAMPSDFASIHSSLLSSGWLCMAQTDRRADYSFGYTPSGFAERVYHLHLRRFGDCDELYFIEYLRAHPEIAKEYEALKLSLWKPFEHDRDGYTEAKTEFIRRFTQEAKRGRVCFRFAEKSDTPLILRFIKELAAYEGLENEVTADEATLEQWVFDKHGAEVILAYQDETPIGFALFFHNFSTFLGRSGVYLEDLYIVPEKRGKGCGTALLRELAAVAVRRGCGRLEWWCLDRNTPSVQFYLSLGAQPMDEWTVFRITGDTLRSLGGENASQSEERQNKV